MIDFNFDWPDYVFKNLKKNNNNHQNSNKQMKLQKLHDSLLLLRENNIDFAEYSKHLVFGDGNIDSKLMLIGEAPGEEEEKEKLPFVGKSGQLLNNFLKELNYDREKYYITNIMPWRPPNNRTPKINEVELMKPFVLQHIQIIAPKLIVSVGSIALKALGIDNSIAHAQGNLFDNSIGSIFCIYHPSYVLRLPAKKRDFWLSLLKMDEIYTKM